MNWGYLLNTMAISQNLTVEVRCLLLVKASLVLNSMSGFVLSFKPVEGH